MADTARREATSFVDALPRGPRPMTGRLRTAFEAVALAAILCGLIQFGQQYELELQTYGFGWAVYGTIGATLVALASVYAISRRGLRLVAWMWLAIYALAFAVTVHDLAVGVLPDARYAFGMLSIGMDSVAACLIILWLDRIRKGIA